MHSSMANTSRISPLLDPNSPLDKGSRELVRELNLREQEKAVGLPSDDPLDAGRRRRVELTYEEMWNQPEAIEQSLAREGEAIRTVARRATRNPIDRIILVGCGDSLASMMAVRALYENLLRIPCEPIEALEFAYYYHSPVDSRTMVITLSSSGTSARVVEALLLAKAMGAPTLALSNTADSPLLKQAQDALLIHAERKGWPTQSSTAAMAVLVLFGLEMARARGVDQGLIQGLERELYEVPGMIASTLERYNAAMLALAEEEADHPLYLFAAGGPSYASAMIGAAKVKECSPDHAIAIQLEEYHHYNSQKAGEPLFIVAPKGPSLARALDTAREGKRWGGHVYSLICEGDETLEEFSDLSFFLPQIDEQLAPMTYSVPLQMFAYHVAMAKFRAAEAKAGRA